MLLLSYHILVVQFFSSNFSIDESNLQNAYIRVGVSHMPLESHSRCGDVLNSITAKEEPVNVMCSPRPVTGQVISIQLHQRWAERLPENMTLCEVEVFATGPLTSKYP